MLPEGWSGAATWGSGFSVDAARGHLYVPVGNIYTVPPEVAECERQRADDAPSCIPDDVIFDAIVALDIATGNVVWVFRSVAYEAWSSGNCGAPPFTHCPFPVGPDFDFGSAPLLFTQGLTEGSSVDLLGAGSKSGWFYTLSRDTGTLVWRTRVDPGGLLGGVAFGAAYDGQRIYVPGANSLVQPNRLVRGTELRTTRGSAVTALDPATGAILWQTAEPHNTAGEINSLGVNLARCAGPATVANGVVFVSSMHPTAPNFFALEAATGVILWEFFCGGSANSGPSVVDGMVLWACGYERFGGSYADELFAFAVPAQHVPLNLST
eukprot:TRINITY_DN10981_c0_g1_i1.p2 TRINITY_DN10981_c0_g1~~TRINITY_DN10981_c0_g1_i1.p2  ORF type:complete len:323 (+),score=64.32 TRINITY_DN10981_c0_g1_i1:675-1643(+)